MNKNEVFCQNSLKIKNDFLKKNTYSENQAMHPRHHQEVHLHQNHHLPKKRRIDVLESHLRRHLPDYICCLFLILTVEIGGK